ncbi:MAG: type II CAAX endopeptidase family protein [Bryobacteraceae bacterium]
MIPTFAEGRDKNVPFWTYTDLALFLCTILPSFALGMVTMRLLRSVAPALVANETAAALSFQALLYAFMLTSLYFVVASKHQRPFWNSLAWTLPVPHPFFMLVAGPTLAVSLSALGVALHAPEVDSQISKLITSRTAFAELMFFGVVLAPVFEELVFRGFLFPLIAEYTGPWPAVVLTAVPFALLHGAQYSWAWQQITIIGIAGLVFGVVRHKTGTTAASSLLHAAYNLTGFAGYMVARWATLR